jgi:hypothetical protein
MVVCHTSLVYSRDVHVQHTIRCGRVCVYWLINAKYRLRLVLRLLLAPNAHPSLSFVTSFKTRLEAHHEAPEYRHHRRLVFTTVVKLGLTR